MGIDSPIAGKNTDRLVVGFKFDMVWKMVGKGIEKNDNKMDVFHLLLIFISSLVQIN